MSEILAPAGNKNSAYAAINAGADAIYLGLNKYSARSSAENFGQDEFEEICKYAHAFGVKVYAALNTAVLDSEVEDFVSSAVSAWNSGADALIIQDLFLGKFIKENFPEIKLHLSTQAGTCNVYGARLAKEFGFDRVILARETAFVDIKKIAEIIETEVFVQGALCTCFSGQCYMSSFAGGNSGNRGRCKQPCRKIYSIDREGFEEQAYRLSLSDLSIGENIFKLIEAGVASFKIEGRMRRPEYVSAAVSYYRDMLDGRQSDICALKRTFNRGNYTKGLAFGQDKSFISSAVQGHIGEFVGVIKVENAKYICQCRLKFNKGDGFKVLRGGKEVGGGVYGGEVKSGFVIATRDRLKNGDKVFITTDTALNAKLLEKRRLIPINIKAVFNAGQPAFADINGMRIIGDNELEGAKSRPLTEEEIVVCFKKVDGFPFKPEISVQTDGVFVPASVLNAFRRKVFSEYYNKISASNNKKYPVECVIPRIKTGKNPKTAVIATDLRGVSADIGIFKPDDYPMFSAEKFKDFNGEKFLFVPSFLTGEEAERISDSISLFDGIYCDGYFGKLLAKKLGKAFFAGTGFNITNSATLSQCDAKYVALSKEITFKEAEKLCTDNAFCLASGNIKVMDLIYCPFEKKCSSCDKRRLYTLTDAEGRRFPLRRYKTSECRFEIYNCNDLFTEGCRAGRLIDLTVEGKRDKTRGHSVNGII